MANKLRELRHSLKLNLALEPDADLHLEDYRIFVGKGKELFLD
jgi:hypothetical protein